MLTHAVFQVTAQAAGAKKHSLPDWTDPADEFADTPEAGPRRETGAARAAQVAAFIQAAGGE